MIGPTLVCTRVPHGPWTYEPHAQGRTLSSTFFSVGLGLPFSLLFWFCLLLLHLRWYLFCLHYGLLHFPSALVLISSAFLSVNGSFCRLVLVPLSAPRSTPPASIRAVGESIASFRCFGKPHRRPPFPGLLG